MAEDGEIEVCFRWQKMRFNETFPVKTTKISDLKQLLYERTRVEPARQKIFGLKPIKGRLQNDTLLCELKFTRPPLKCGMIGSPIAEAAKILQTAAPTAASAVADYHLVDDLDLKFVPTAANVSKDLANRKALEDCFARCEKIRWINPPRDGKPLLVLDLDHTLLHFDSATTHAETHRKEAMKRPGMDEFLATVYPHYDICLWSQTSWKWVEIKATALGMLTNPKYSVAFTLDKSHMFDITPMMDGPPQTRPTKKKKKNPRERHQVKALELIWRQCTRPSPDGGTPVRIWGPHNTVHVDDLARNFALNRRNGIVIKAFRARTKHKKKRSKSQDPEIASLAMALAAAADRELERLSKYLLWLVKVPDMSAVDHSNWGSVSR